MNPKILSTHIFRLHNGHMKITNLKRTYNIQHQRGIMFSNGFGTCPFKCGYFEIQLARVSIL